MDWLPIVLPIAGAAVAGTVGVLYGNKKGLPDIRQEIEDNQEKLLGVYKERLEQAEAKAADAEEAVNECKPRLKAAEETMKKQDREIAELYRRLDASGLGRSRPRG